MNQQWPYHGPSHVLLLTIDGPYVEAEWGCEAQVGAECRMTCPEGCEEWYPDHEHTLVDAGKCLVVTWLENALGRDARREVRGAAFRSGLRRVGQPGLLVVLRPVQEGFAAVTLLRPWQEPWMEQALCAETDPDLFFPTMTNSPDTRTAKNICARCPVSADCLTYALRTPCYGIWGGTTERERRKLGGTRPGHPINHGTEPGYAQHRRRGEQPCQPCTDAQTIANRERRQRRESA